jgi:hypothetical protein
MQLRLKVKSRFFHCPPHMLGRSNINYPPILWRWTTKKCRYINWRSITFLMPYWCPIICIFPFVNFCPAASVTKLYTPPHHQGMQILVRCVTMPSTIRWWWSEQPVQNSVQSQCYSQWQLEYDVALNSQGNGPIRHVETCSDFFFTARVHTTKSTIKILAANAQLQVFFKLPKLLAFLYAEPRVPEVCTTLPSV